MSKLTKKAIAKAEEYEYDNSFPHISNLLRELVTKIEDLEEHINYLNESRAR